MIGPLLASLGQWPTRRWGAAVVTAVVFGVVVAVPTDLIDTPYFSREIPPTWWSVPALIVSAALAGLVVATYVDSPAPQGRAETRRGWLGSALTFFAVGCPVCNKLVLLLLGTSGALQWFEPLQPVLQLLALALLGWALWTRLRGELLCDRRTDSPGVNVTPEGGPASA